MRLTPDLAPLLLQDTAWLDMYLSEVPHVVYQMSDGNATRGAQHATRANKGNEAMAYLQAILDYWHRLPASIAFIHGHRCGAFPLLCMQPATGHLGGLIKSPPSLKGPADIARHLLP
jgi:hypothetical protein